MMLHCKIQCILKTFLFSVANWAIPLAAIGDFKKDPELISPFMTPGKNSLVHILQAIDSLQYWSFELILFAVTMVTWPIKVILRRYDHVLRCSFSYFYFSISDLYYFSILDFYFSISDLFLKVRYFVMVKRVFDVSYQQGRHIVVKGE